MEENTISLSISGIKDMLTKIEEQIEIIRPYKEKLKSHKESISDMNSDFIDEIRRVLSNMGDTKAPKLVDSLEDYAKQMKSMLNKFETTDQQIGKAISEGKEETE